MNRIAFQRVTTPALSAAVGVLRAMLHDGPKARTWGICANLRSGVAVAGHHEQRWRVQDATKHLFETWPFYSGEEAYPVPHGEFEDPEVAYNATDDLWADEYGESRKSLLAHLIEGFEAELNQREQEEAENAPSC